MSRAAATTTGTVSRILYVVLLLLGAACCPVWSAPFNISDSPGLLHHGNRGLWSDALRRREAADDGSQQNLLASANHHHGRRVAHLGDAAFDHESSTPEDEYFPDHLGPAPLGDYVAEDEEPPSPPQVLPPGMRLLDVEEADKDYDDDDDDELEDDADEEEDNEINNPAPKYMRDLYRKYSRDRYSHPMANIVRSFENLYPEPTEGPIKLGNSTRVHTLVFNVTSISKDEDLYLGELRLYKLVEADRNQYVGMDRYVSVYEVFPGGAAVVVRGGRYRRDTAEMHLTDSLNLISSKHIYGRHSGWETFDVSEAVKQWVRAKKTTQVLEVRIETVAKRSEQGNTSGEMDITTLPNKNKGPLLVVFTNDPRRRRSENRELHDIIAHEMTQLAEVHYYDEGEYPDGDYYEDSEYHENYVDAVEDEAEEEGVKAEIHKRDTRRQLERQQRASNQSSRFSVVARYNRTVSYRARQEEIVESRREYMRDLYREVMDIHDEEEGGESEDDLVNIYRRKRSKKKKKRNICKRKSMYVNFEDINWHSWIIAPKGYEAYECRGRCYFPLSDHLTPTKHAIIQTLLHTTHREKASKACCVPTKLDPISILYVDEQQVVTYKYKYEGMQVAECGCR